MRDSINVPDGVVTDARARKQRGEMEGKDVWKEALEPRTAARARTIPVLESEVDKLKATLRGTSPSISIISRRQLTCSTVRGGKPRIVRRNEE